jgi:hypothetical protein
MFTQKLFKLFFISLLIPLNFSCNQKGEEYVDIFGEDYTAAEKFFQNNLRIRDTLTRYGVDPNLAISIVFPEAIRYSVLSDIAETHSLEVLYTQYGSKYSDFSIGRFQIKPSFAFRLEKDWALYIRKENLNPILKPFDTLDNNLARFQRIIRLKDEKWQVRYLIMFCKLIENEFKGEWLSEEQKILFFASAYNVGYWYSSEVIKSRGRQNFYHTSILKPQNCFNYADISLCYYKKTKMPKYIRHFQCVNTSR